MIEKTITIGHIGRTPVVIGIQALIESRLLVQANSGAGKSFALRRLLEQTHGSVQQIVIDVEGEFHTLREKYDYILAGKGGDCPATIQSAALLARRLLELQVSAIIQIDELKKPHRFLFVKRFIESLMEAPKRLWHPCMVVVDEAHIFAPEKSKAESTAAVIDLMTRGRKRGYCGILATQRISKLHKDASAEANNKLIGRAAQDLDMKRAADELGFNTKAATRSLRNLKPGQFYAFGPAISEEVQLIKVGKVSTTHPKVGQRMASIPPPRGKIKKVLAELHDLPQEAAEEASSLADAKQTIQQLKRELKTAQKGGGADSEAVQRAVDAARRQVSDAAWEYIGKITDSHEETEERILNGLKEVRGKLEKVAAFLPSKTKGPSSRPNLIPLKTKPAAPSPSPLPPSLPKANGDASVSLNSGEGRMLSVLILRYPTKLTTAQLATLSHLKKSGGTFKTYKSRLKTKGFAVEVETDLWQATDEGVEALGGELPDPMTSEELVSMWKASVGSKPGEMLDLLVANHPDSLTFEELALQTGLTLEGGTFKTYVSRLRSNGIATTEGQTIKASDDLFQ